MMLKLKELEEKERQKQELKAKRDQERVIEKERKDQLRLQEKAARDAIKSVETKCNRVLGRTAGLQARMLKALEDDYVGSVPKHVSYDAKQSLVRIQKMSNIANKHVKGTPFDNNELELIDTVEDECKQGEAALKALNEFVAISKKHGKREG